MQIRRLQSWLGCRSPRLPYTLGRPLSLGGFSESVSPKIFDERPPSGSNAVATDLPYEHPVVVGIFIDLFPILKSKIFV